MDLNELEVRQALATANAMKGLGGGANPGADPDGPEVVDLSRMRKLFIYGRSEAGKTTLTQALKGETLRYDKTQYTNSYDVVIDTPGEYIESKEYGHALYCFSFESDLDAQLVGADEPFNLIDPGVPTAVNRPFIGIITKVDSPRANVPMVRQWLEDSGCYPIFEVDSVTGKGIKELRDYLMLPNKPKMTLKEAIAVQNSGQSEFY